MHHNSLTAEKLRVSIGDGLRRSCNCIQSKEGGIGRGRLCLRLVAGQLSQNFHQKIERVETGATPLPPTCAYTSYQPRSWRQTLSRDGTHNTWTDHCGGPTWPPCRLPDLCTLRHSEGSPRTLSPGPRVRFCVILSNYVETSVTSFHRCFAGLPAKPAHLNLINIIDISTHICFIATTNRLHIQYLIHV